MPNQLYQSSHPHPLLPPALSKWFDAAARARGDQYLASGKVHIAQASSTALQARVTGTQVYTIDITAREGEIQLSCTCRHAREFGSCKHLWAVLRQADADGTLGPLLHTAGAQPVTSFLTEHGQLHNDRLKDHEQVANTTPTSAPVFVMPDWMRVLDNARRQMQFQTQHIAQTAPAKGAIVMA